MKVKIINTDYNDENEINYIIKDMKIIDIKYVKTIFCEKILVMYEE